MNTYKCHTYEFKAKNDSGALAHIMILSPGTPIDLIRWSLYVRCNTGEFLPAFNTLTHSATYEDRLALIVRLEKLSRTT